MTSVPLLALFNRPGQMQRHYSVRAEEGDHAGSRGAAPEVCCSSWRPALVAVGTQAAEMVRGCAACALVATAVESLPLKEVDNLTVPLATALAAQYAFPH